jgi:hypothetical protein
MCCCATWRRRAWRGRDRRRFLLEHSGHAAVRALHRTRKARHGAAFGRLDGVDEDRAGQGEAVELRVGVVGVDPSSDWRDLDGLGPAYDRRGRQRRRVRLRRRTERVRRGRRRWVMSIFEIVPSSLPNGEFAAAWFDDEHQTWNDERLNMVGSLAGDWRVPRLQLVRPERGVTDVLYNPNALAVSGAVRERFSCFSELEFLPIAVEGCGPFFILRATATVEVTPGFSIQRSPTAGNIMVLHGFPTAYVPSTAFFRVRQPPDSAAGRAGYVVPCIYANAEGARAVEAACGAYLSARAVSTRVPS